LGFILGLFIVGGFAWYLAQKFLTKVLMPDDEKTKTEQSKESYPGVRALKAQGWKLQL
jgi:hypothetical protein